MVGLCDVEMMRTNPTCKPLCTMNHFSKSSRGKITPSQWPGGAVSQQKGKKFAALWLPKRNFYHKACLVKLTPLQVTLQTSSFKHPSHMNPGNNGRSAHTGTHRHTATAVLLNNQSV